MEAKVWKFPSTETPRLEFTHSRVFLFLYFEFLFLSALLVPYYCFLLRHFFFFPVEQLRKTGVFGFM